LQRTSSKGYTARFTINGPDDLAHHIDFPSENPLSGSNITAVRITIEKGEMPEGLPELKAHTLPDLEYETSITISGYPKENWANGKLVDNKFALYSSSSEEDKGMGPNTESIEGYGGVVGFSMDTSIGQEGGALVNTETGVVIGILFGVGEMPDGQ